MSDEALRDLARRAGILVDWQDAADRPRQVAPDVLRRVLKALRLPCDTEAETRDSSERLAAAQDDAPPPVAAGERCFMLDPPGGRLWGVGAQIYGLRRPGDGGIGDFAAVAMLAESAARQGADAVALSPAHALFAADTSRYGPYSPSSRLFLNPLHAALDEDIVAGEGDLIDWPACAARKFAAFRRLFDRFRETDDFAKFRVDGGTLLEQHATFETLHGARLTADAGDWNWRGWPAPLRDPASAAVRQFAAEHAHEVTFHVFLQYLADRSLAAAQQRARRAGMRIGLIADLAVGMDVGGSHAWSHQEDLLVGLAIGAPPDLINQRGQNWGLTAFSPQALKASAYAPFRATLRAAMRHAGGVRIDHVMGLTRLWLIPEGASADEGAYLTYPLDDLLRLIALESQRHKAIVIGEDLGTVPAGFPQKLDEAGILGMRVLWFEHDGTNFRQPAAWSRDAVAMTSTHDLATVAGWWTGHDREVRAALGLAAEEDVRAKDRRDLWQAFRAAGTVPDAASLPDDPAPVVDAAIDFVARTPSRLALVPLEDMLGLEDQPNLPGTIDEHPNWRRRYAPLADDMFADPKVAARARSLTRRKQP